MSSAEFSGGRKIKKKKKGVVAVVVAVAVAEVGGGVRGGNINE